MKKNLSKLFAMALALIMVMALTVPAMAATITITNSAKGETYNVYKIFDVTMGTEPICGKEEGAEHTHDASCYNIAYTIAEGDDWYGTVNTYATDENGMKLTESTTDGVYIVSVTDAFDAAAFAATLGNNTTGKTADMTGTGTGEALTITVDEAGYYFVDTTLGSLCSLLTSDQSVALVEKNSIPSLEKFVEEDSKTDDAWGESATADYGQTVDFWLSVNTGTNAATAADNKTGVDADYTITDVIPANMTLVGTDDDYITIEGWTKDTDYTETYDAEARTLTIILKQAKLATLGENADIEIYYSATLNNTAAAGVAETNTATLTYKAQKFTDTATVVTYSIGGTSEAATITKVDGETRDALPGVKFVLMKGNQYATFDDGLKLTGWVNEQEDATELVTDDSGNIFAYGLDADTYTLKETYTLPGYNLLDDTITAVINEDGTVKYDYTNDAEDTPANTIEIENNTGSILPSTGGMGTTLFYTIGGVLVVAAGVLLVTKKRMNNMEG